MNSKKKGNAGEHKFAHWLMSHGFKGNRNSMSGGSVWKGDIGNTLDLNIEVKTVKKINLLKCWQQTDRDSTIAHSNAMLAIHFDHMPENEWLVVLHSEDWIEMMKKIKPEQIVIKTENSSENRERKWALENLKSAIQKALKNL